MRSNGVKQGRIEINLSSNLTTACVIKRKEGEKHEFDLSPLENFDVIAISVAPAKQHLAIVLSGANGVKKFYFFDENKKQYHFIEFLEFIQAIGLSDKNKFIEIEKLPLTLKFREGDKLCQENINITEDLYQYIKKNNVNDDFLKVVAEYIHYTDARNRFVSLLVANNNQTIIQKTIQQGEDNKFFLKSDSYFGKKESGKSFTEIVKEIWPASKEKVRRKSALKTSTNVTIASTERKIHFSPTLKAEEENEFDKNIITRLFYLASRRCILTTASADELEEIKSIKVDLIMLSDAILSQNTENKNNDAQTALVIDMAKAIKYILVYFVRKEIDLKRKTLDVIRNEIKTKENLEILCDKTQQHDTQINQIRERLDADELILLKNYLNDSEIIDFLLAEKICSKKKYSEIKDKLTSDNLTILRDYIESNKLKLDSGLQDKCISHIGRLSSENDILLDGEKKLVNNYQITNPFKKKWKDTIDFYLSDESKRNKLIEGLDESQQFLRDKEGKVIDSEVLGLLNKFKTQIQNNSFSLSYADLSKISDYFSENDTSIIVSFIDFINEVLIEARDPLANAMDLLNEVLRNKEGFNHVLSGLNTLKQAHEDHRLFVDLNGLRLICHYIENDFTEHFAEYSKRQNIEEFDDHRKEDVYYVYNVLVGGIAEKGDDDRAIAEVSTGFVDMVAEKKSDTSHAGILSWFGL